MIAETVCAAVSAAGLGIAVITAYRKRFLAAARIAAYSLVPVALVMTGVVDWLADTAFSPTAWAGFGLLGLSWVLFRHDARGGAPARRHPQGAQGGPGGGGPRSGGPPGFGALPGPGHPPGRPAGARLPGRGRLQRHRGHPQEARHMTVPHRG